MQVNDQNLIIDRAIALHKIIRLLTFGTAGNGYLTFIGNEFGHPEWVDFPRAGNDWSYKYARRQWSLRDDQRLKYHFLADFDQAMMEVGEKFRVLDHEWPYKLYEHVQDQVLAFERAGLVFVFNLHPTNSYEGRVIPCRTGRYSVALDTDAADYGGFGRLDHTVHYEATGSDPALRLYLPSRTGLVLRAL
jgi:1,4-alpha-glucan branching enzyme